MGFLDGKTVTLIGGSGFIGRALVEKLARAGARILVLGRNAERVKRMKPLGTVGQITALAGDATDEATLLMPRPVPPYLRPTVDAPTERSAEETLGLSATQLAGRLLDR